MLGEKRRQKGCCDALGGGCFHGSATAVGGVQWTLIPYKSYDSLPVPVLPLRMALRRCCLVKAINSLASKIGYTSRTSQIHCLKVGKGNADREKRKKSKVSSVFGGNIKSQRSP